MDFEKEYKEEALQYINIVKRFGAIQENDIKEIRGKWYIND